jgi:hypothetical protein
MPTVPEDVRPKVRPPFADAGQWERVRARIAVTSSHHVWTGALGDDGYPRFWVSDDVEGSPVVRLVRWMWAAHHEPVPVGLVVRHRCDRPWCVRVECLDIGTQSDNLRDAARRDRITNTKLVGRADKRGAARAARAVRRAVLDAVGQGIHLPEELAEVVAAVEAAGDPYADQIALF